MKAGRTGIVLILSTLFVCQAAWCAIAVHARASTLILRNTARLLETMQSREEIASYLESFLDKRDQEFLHVAELSLVVPADLKFKVNHSRLLLSSASGRVAVEIVDAAKKVYRINGHRWVFRPEATVQQNFRAIDRLISQPAGPVTASDGTRGARQLASASAAGSTGTWLEAAAHADGGFSTFCSTVYLTGLIFTGVVPKRLADDARFRQSVITPANPPESK